MMADTGRSMRLLAVDTFVALESYDPQFLAILKDQQTVKVAEGQCFRPQFDANVRRLGLTQIVCPIQLPSESAAYAMQPATAEVVFVDADHAPTAVVSDIRNWWRVLKRGGRMAGHDIYTYAHMAKSVAEGLSDFGVTFEVIGAQNIWHTTKL